MTNQNNKESTANASNTKLADYKRVVEEMRIIARYYGR